MNERPTASQHIRIQKYLADAGICSRRDAEKLVAESSVSVNGKVIREPGFKINPGHDKVRVRGKLIQFNLEVVGLLFHKPRSFTCNRDPLYPDHSLMDLYPELEGFKVSVGLEKNASGLIFLTNDGGLHQAITRKIAVLPRRLRLRFARPLDEIQRNKLKTGVRLENRTFRTDKLKELPPHKGEIWYELQTAGLKDRWLEKVFLEIGSPYQRLVQVGFAEIVDLKLKKGMGRAVTPKELLSLQESVGYKIDP